MIEFQDVSKVHVVGETRIEALRGVTATIERSFTFVVGPSGSGKSTLLYLLGALDEPTGGRILVDGRRLDELTTQERDLYRREQVGFVFQSFNLLRNLTALDNVLVPFVPTGVSGRMRQDAERLLKRVGLGERMFHRPGQLSGGEQQRVAIARALLKRPRLVLADEPTGELDSRTGGEVMGYLRELHAEFDTTVVVVTHDRSYIRDGDRVIGFLDGRIVDDRREAATMPNGDDQPSPERVVAEAERSGS